uniref:Aminotransferase class I/classII domain-containing protein n=1 Tax=Panagrolaimus sp. ES5 TaxID=591445 RepID=A0AC34F6P1_9BILA
MNYVRMPIEIESPEQMGYDNLEYNLTESSVTDMKLGDLNLNLQDLIVAYGDHIGHPKLRQLIAEEAGVKADDVLITTGAAMALFIVSTTLLGKGDKLIVEQPNYATNIETPRAIGAKIDFLHLKIEQKFHLSLEEIDQKLTPDTKLLSITVPHNPTGTVIPRDDLDSIIKMALEKNVKLLVDETYRDMTFGDKLPVAASLSSNVISVSSLSKTFGLPGIRVGWLICQDKELMKKFLAAKEQMIICGSIVDEEIAFRFMETRQQKLPEILAEIQTRFGIVKSWMKESDDILEWIEPQGGVVCFPRIKVKIDLEEFYQVLNGQFKTFVGPGHWFEMEKSFMRIGYGWPKSHDELRQGLSNVSEAIRYCLEKQK